MTANILQSVATYNNAGLALLTNLNCVLATANKKYLNFETMPANLGSTVNFELPPRFVVNDGLIANFQPYIQRILSLTVDKAKNVSYMVNDQEFIFNVDRFMSSIGRSAVTVLGGTIEKDVSLEFLKTYRFFGDGVTPINSFTQLAQALANMRDYGAANIDFKGYLPVTDVPAIIGSGLSQFAPNRNNEIANSWELGNYSFCDWYQSNQLPVHTAGTCGENADTLTFVSINAAGTQITLSGVSVNSGAVKENDVFQFDNDIRFLTFSTYSPTAQKVQFRATADADGTAGTVVVNIDAPLISTPGDQAQNLTRPLTTSDTCKAMPSHRVGAITSGNPLFLALPKLPAMYPYASTSEMDTETGASMRLSYGSVFGAGTLGYINDSIWGKKLAPEYAMRLLLPV